MIWLNSEVRDDIMADISTKLLVLSAKDPKADITLLINSPGGSITAGMMLYDIINLIPNDIRTVAVGMAASMGQFLLTVGTPGKRFVTASSRVLLHQPLGGYGGTSSEIVTQAELINNMKEKLAGITASRTGKTVEQIHRDGDRDRWFTAEEALEYGFADHLISSFDDIDRLSNAVNEKPVKKGNKK